MKVLNRAPHVAQSTTRRRDGFIFGVGHEHEGHAMLVERSKSSHGYGIADRFVTAQS